jgi:hypothetical protein
MGDRDPAAVASSLGGCFRDLTRPIAQIFSRRNTLQEQQSAITGHSPRDVEAILEAHYLGGRVELAEQAMTKLDARYGNGT